MPLLHIENVEKMLYRIIRGETDFDPAKCDKITKRFIAEFDALYRPVQKDPPKRTKTFGLKS